MLIFLTIIDFGNWCDLNQWYFDCYVFRSRCHPGRWHVGQSKTRLIVFPDSQNCRHWIWKISRIVSTRTSPRNGIKFFHCPRYCNVVLWLHQSWHRCLHLPRPYHGYLTQSHNITSSTLNLYNVMLVFVHPQASKICVSITIKIERHVGFDYHHTLLVFSSL